MPPHRGPAPARGLGFPALAKRRAPVWPRRRPKPWRPPFSGGRGHRRPPRASIPMRRSPATTTGSLSPFLKSRSRRLPPPPHSALGRSSRSSLCLLRCENAVGFHREILGQPQPVGPRRGLQIPRLDPLPELAFVVRAGEGRRVLLGLMLENREDLG